MHCSPALGLQGLRSRKSESSHSSADPAGFRGFTHAAMLGVVFTD